MMPSAFTKPHTAGWKPRAHVRIRVKRVQRPDPRASHRRLIEREPVELAGRQVTCVRCRLELVDETGVAAIVRHVPVAVGGIRFLLVAEAPHAGQPLRCAGLWVDLPDPPRAQFGVVYERELLVRQVRLPRRDRRSAEVVQARRDHLDELDRRAVLVERQA